MEGGTSTIITSEREVLTECVDKGCGIRQKEVHVRPSPIAEATSPDNADEGRCPPNEQNHEEFQTAYMGGFYWQLAHTGKQNQWIRALS
jgi:hypothetical protein